ncbi:MAG: cold-shock DNA-binding domain family protein [Osedax symbiont Rs2]|nr:MAG: cold-shock DNA-binding domain family protein [Osedax symbiont Rs2]
MQIKVQRLALLIAATFTLFLSYSISRQQLTAPIGLFYLFASVITFLAYARDKSAAKTGKWRIKEVTLQLFSLFGGWPGAIVAQKLLRHKSRKLSFQIIFWLMMSVNLTVFILSYSGQGRSWLLSFLS